MPVSTGPLGEPRAKRCKLCDESSHLGDSGSGYWQLQLDRDLVDTISAIYPEWFKDNMAEGGGSPTSPRESPPKAIIDTSPIMIDQNKESLKVKLLLRRPFDQLVAQGIMPPHKTPAAYHGQRRQLERAKTGDMLKAKIQQRPPRQELERRHILEVDPSHVDPSLAERQRMLKKAKLADHLNDQLSHRPGPLELIQKNILHTEEPIEEAVKTGRIPYKATSEGQLHRPQLPSNYVNPEEDSQSSEGDNRLSPGPSDVLETAAKSAGIVVSLLQPSETVVVTTAGPILKKDNNEIVFADMCRSHVLSQASASSPASLVSSTSTLSPLSSVASPVPSVVSQPATPAPPPLPPVSLVSRPIQSPVRSDSLSGKDKNRKKSKTKSVPKARTIKFHEYKGPPNAQKNSSSSQQQEESSYDLLLKQQTLLLQFQLQLQHKYPQIILPASQKASVSESSNSSSNGGNINVQQPSPAPSTLSESSVPSKITGRLEDMKVSDLKAELKRRSLPVSGSKPQLIERLKPFTSTVDVMNQNPASIDSSVHSNSMDQCHNSPMYQSVDSPQESLKDEKSELMDVDPLSPAPQTQQLQEPSLQHKIPEKSNEDLVRKQQRQIEELQRELTISQLKLQAATRVEPKAQLLALQKHLHARQQQQQQRRLQQEQQQQLQQQQQNFVLQMKQLQALQARQNEEQQKLQQQQQQQQQQAQQQIQQQINFQNQKNIAGGLILNGADAALIYNQLMQGKAKILNGCRSNSSPNFLNSVPIIAAPEIKAEFASEQKSPKEIKIEFAKSPPPQYNEATKHMNKKNHIKSQIVDDVLEILIKNGELPPSAANDPLTPNSAGTKSNEPLYPPQVLMQNHLDDNHNHNHNHTNGIDSDAPEATLGIDPTDLLETLDNIEDLDFSQLVMELGGCHNQTDGNFSEHQQEDENVAMDTDDWLESLLPSDGPFNGNGDASTAVQEQDLGSYDPLLGIAPDPFDPFNLEDVRTPADLTATLSWEKIDYAA